MPTIRHAQERGISELIITWLPHHIQLPQKMGYLLASFFMPDEFAPNMIYFRNKHMISPIALKKEDITWRLSNKALEGQQ